MGEPESNDNHDAGDAAELSSPRRWRISPVWLIPLAAVLIGAWLFYQNIISKGPVVTLDMDSAEGIAAGTTQVKVRSVEVGHVSGVRLAKNHKHAVVTVQMKPKTAGLLGDHSRFWVVKARVGPKGISGLGTIISGAYIQLQPGQASSDKRRFSVLNNPPAIPTDEPGVRVELISAGDNSLSIGDPVVYQGQNVGEIESADFSLKKKQMVYGVFVHRPFAALITQQTQFWLRSGVNFHLGANGVDIQLGSLKSVLAGGVTFGLPSGVHAGKKAGNGKTFKLYETHNAAVQNRFKRKIKYVVLLNDTVRGLSAGAPVEYRGLRVGTVEKVPFYRAEFQIKSFSNFKIPVLIAIEPQRPSLAWAHSTNKQWRRRNERFFRHGMRATIKSSNLLTGAMFINLAFDHHAANYTPRTVGKYEVWPSEPSQITSIQQQLSSLMDKLNALDVKPIFAQLKHTANTASQTLDGLDRVTRNINKLLEKPGTRRLPEQLRATLKQIQKTLANFQQGTPAYQNLGASLAHFNQVLDNLAPLVRTLRDHPNALIFGHSDGPDPVPKAAR